MVISIQMKATNNWPQTPRTPSQPPFRACSSHFINLAKTTLFFFKTTFLGPYHWKSFYLSIYLLLCTWTKYGRVCKNINHLLITWKGQWLPARWQVRGEGGGVTETSARPFYTLWILKEENISPIFKTEFKNKNTSEKFFKIFKNIRK